MGQKDEPVIGVPYYVGQNPYQAGLIPPNAVFGEPKGIPLQQTMFRDTPAPFNCLYCGNSGVTLVRSKPSLAAVIGCMMPFMMGFCFLCPSMDCLWHKFIVLLVIKRLPTLRNRILAWWWTLLSGLKRALHYPQTNVSLHIVC